MTMSRGINVRNKGKTCCVATCPNPADARGLCKNHYDKYLKERNPEYRKRQLANCTAWAKRNLEHVKQQGKLYRATRLPEQKRSCMLRNKYALLTVDYEKMLSAQGGKCAICGKTTNDFKKDKHLHIDHCHVSGRIRGLLCFRCNFGLGWFQHDIARFQKAIRHLQFENEYPDKKVPKCKLKKHKHYTKKISVGYADKEPNLCQEAI